MSESEQDGRRRWLLAIALTVLLALIALRIWYTFFLF